MANLGFTFYPKDWWTSDAFFEFTLVQRYVYLECLFVMYANDGYMKTQKTQVENRLRTQISEEDWKVVTERFVIENGQFTHQSVNKRLRKATANRENGKKGGRPRSQHPEKGQNEEFEKPKKPKSETQNNPPYKREIEIESKIEVEEENKKGIAVDDELNSSDLPKPTPWGEYQSMDDLEKVLLSHKSWQADFGKSLGLDHPDHVPIWIEKFFIFCKGSGKEHRKDSEAKSHCQSWTRRQIELGKTIETVVAAKASVQLDGIQPSQDGMTTGERSGKWIWLNNGWRDTTIFTPAQKRRNGLA
ncbi:hypothetical protein FAZ19_16150 [Sphingobacterium alkalisoli]|uniref:DUF7833 domain-containing protein n=1 Tax=Sphingobacterium alkalisoli TaxID=1874115 RepID=A0A4U0GXK6_9SPHI|nr:hypothetical protein [Sphingobacterium alkalisoli]TJY63798.1 hypothetical protein FAZ19_16150 [Sphingobacterium alkalisoli]GGH24820.1 hypothetical protein GCM10011418_33000 [Sphingobacterium alkalisoli]